MENQINNINQEPQPVSESLAEQPTQIPKKIKTNYLLIATIVLFFSMISGVGGYLLGKGNAASLQNDTQNQMLFSPTPTSTDAGTSQNGRQFTIPQIGLTFELPEEIYNLGIWTTEILTAETGNNICFHLVEKQSLLVSVVNAGGIGICDGKNFTANAASRDFSAGRGGVFTDFQGFEIVDGKYFGVFPLGKLIEIPTDIMEVVENPNGIIIVKTQGKDIEGMTPFLPEGWVGAMVNINNNPNYRGIALQFGLTEGFTEQDFDKILSSLKFVN